MTTDLGYFYRLATKDTAGAGSALQRNTAVSYAIYSSPLRTDPYLVSVWADAAGVTPKVNPVNQNVGGNNGFDGYLPAGIRYYTRLGTGLTAVDGELFVSHKHFREGASFGHDTIRTETGVDVAPGYGMLMGRNYALEAIGGPAPWASRMFSGSYVNSLPVLDFWFDPGYRRLFLRDGLRLTGAADPPEFNFALAGSFNAEYPDGGVDGTGGAFSRAYAGAGAGFFGWLVWPGTQTGVGAGAGTEYGPRSAIFSAKTYANTAGSVSEINTTVNGQPLGYREAPTRAKHEATGTDTGDYGKFQWDGAQWVHTVTGTPAPAGTALYPSTPTGSGYRLNRLGLGAILMFATGAVGSNTHPEHHVRIGPGKTMAVFADSVESIADGPTRGHFWLRSTGLNNVGDGQTDFVAHFDRKPQSFTVGERVLLGFGIDSTNRPLAAFGGEFRGTSGSPRGAALIGTHNASLTPVIQAWFTEFGNVGYGSDGTADGTAAHAYAGARGAHYFKNRTVEPDSGNQHTGGGLLSSLAGMPRWTSPSDATTWAFKDWRVGTFLLGSETKDWPDIADTASATEDVTVTGAVLGMKADATMSVLTQGLEISAEVTAADTVTVTMRNRTGGAVNLGSGTLRVSVRPMS